MGDTMHSLATRRTTQSLNRACPSVWGRCQRILPILPILLLAVAVLFAPSEALAQGTDASITGTVNDADGEPLPGATVQIENVSTGFSAGTTTDPRGRFALRELPLGTYAVTVTFVGYGGERRTGLELDQGDRIALDFELSQATQELQEVVVEATNFRNRTERLDASTRVTAEQVETLPAADRNFTDLVKLSPRVSSGTNIAGFSGRTNAITLDGVNAKETNFGGSGSSPYELSMAALQEFEVVTNSYDVIEGRGTSGAIKAVSKSGTNEFGGSVFGHFWDKRLAAPTDIRGRSVAGDTKSQQGFTFSGPIIEDKLHFFVGYDGERKSEAYELWAQSTQSGILENGVGERASAENVNRIISILEEKYSLDSGQRQIGFFQRQNSLDTFFGRVDWQMNDTHTLMARYTRDDFVRPNRNNSHIGRRGIHSQTYNFAADGHNALLSLRSQYESLTNSLKLAYYYNRRANLNTNGRVPNLWVNFTSDINGVTEAARLHGRGYEWVPEDQRSEVITLVNNTYYSTDRFDFTFGTENALVEASGLWTHGQQGRFTFSSIEALDNMNPSRFTRRVATEGRELTDPITTRHLEMAVYGQVETDLTDRISATAGLRYDVTNFLSSPEFNPVLEQELGLRNDANPIDWDNIQPRLSVSWDVTGDGRNIVQGGAGWFQGQTLTRPYAQAFVFNGLRFFEIDVTDDNVPTPNYDAYEESFLNIPGQDLAPPEEQRSQIVRFLDPDYEMPFAFRANLSYHRYLTDWWRVGANLYYNRVSDLPMIQNQNLDTDAGFRLNGEGGRRVYGTPAANLREDPRDGFGDDGSKISQRFAEVNMYTSGYRQTSRQVVLETDFELPNRGHLSASYTWNRSKGAAVYHNEVDDRFIGREYNDFDYLRNGFSPDDFRHKLLLVFTSPSIRGFQASGFLNLVQGDRYTAMIDSRTNVSGLPGEQRYTAFVFDPNDPETPDQIAEDMQYVLDNTSDHFREYLERNMGQYATPNGGISPWEPELNVQLRQEIELPFESIGERLVFNVDIFNVLNLLNSDWGGEYNIIDTRLLRVTGFDADARQYEYEVNRSAGEQRYEGPGFTTRFGLKYIF